MKKIFLVLVISINLYAIQFLFKEEVLKCENFVDKKLFCSWGIGKGLDDAKDNFVKNTRIKFDYIFSENKTDVINLWVSQRLSRIERDLNKFYTCKYESSLYMNDFVFYKKYCGVIEFKPEKVEVNYVQMRNINRRQEILRTQGFEAMQKDILKELIAESKERVRKQKELEEK